MKKVLKSIMYAVALLMAIVIFGAVAYWVLSHHPMIIIYLLGIGLFSRLTYIIYQELD